MKQFVPSTPDLNMPLYQTPPINELAIAVQFATPLPVAPNDAVRIFHAVENEFPKLELKERIGGLGTQMFTGAQMVRVTDDLMPRYWFSSADESFLLQVQPNFIGVNWRKRTPPGEQASNPYPGFDHMLDMLRSNMGKVLSTMGTTDVPPPSAVNLYYDNLWVEDRSAVEIFTFWNKLGLVTNRGPKVELSLAQPDGAVAETARVDMTVEMLGATIKDKPTPIAHVVFAGFDYPVEARQIDSAIVNLHRVITNTFERVMKKEVLEAWR
jgi:uncharacterized protein (TIGR04255 family)